MKRKIEKTVLSQEGEHHKKNLTFYRNNKTFLSWVEVLKRRKANFLIKHSKYTTALVFEDNSKMTFILNKYRDKVFMANRMIVSDLKKNPEFEIIKNTKHSKRNYHVKNGLGECSFNEVINLDLSSAYATTLYANGLISEKTFKVLQNLQKHERLPTMGMMAKRCMVFTYKNGECEGTHIETGENSEVFFYLIQKVEECIQQCKDIAGDYYLFHWVDGIFIKNDIPVEDLKRIEKKMEMYGYKYKYEKVINFELTRKNDLIIINMNKNGEDKEYKFSDINHQENFQALVRCIENLEVLQREDTVHEGIPFAPMLERQRGNDKFDFTPFLDIT
jgi:hypothetical protein